MIAVFAAINKKYFPTLLMCQGVVSVMWILIQVWLLQRGSWLQLIYGVTGLSFLIAGIFFYNRKNAAANITDIPDR